MTGNPCELRPLRDTAAAELDRAAVPRLRILAIMFGALTSIVLAVLVLVERGIVVVPSFGEVRHGALIAELIATAAMIAVTRLPTWSPHRVVTIGIAYQIFGALCVAYVEHDAIAERNVSGVAIWICLFVVVPTTPRRAAIAAYGAAAMLPVVALIGVVLDGQPLPTPLACVKFAMTFVVATISLFTARVIYGLNRDVADARKLGAYRLVEKLGHGGMGEVWRAEHRALIRPAAVKVMRRELASGSDVDAMNVRFQREVQATAMLTSPHTVAVYDFGHTTDGSLYYAMELLDGLDAERLVEAHGPQPAARVIHIIRQACESLAEAHERGLVHRDIKPANLYLCALGTELDFVKILDFGLVYGFGRDRKLTVDGSVSGTPAYLPPESAARNHSDARSDLYALGCLAYWLLTGTLVFEGETAAAMMAAHIRDDPRPPSWRTELPIPPELEAIVLACLAKDPADRPQSAEQLSGLLATVPIAPWSRDDARAWWRSHVPATLARARRGYQPAMAASRPRHARVVYDDPTLVAPARV